MTVSSEDRSKDADGKRQAAADVACGRRPQVSQGKDVACGRRPQVSQGRDVDVKRKAAAGYLWLITLLLSASGASCPTLRQPLASPTPTLFAGPPTLSEVIAAVNTTSGQIRQLQTDSATLSVQGMPSLRASLAAAPPKNFRLRASFIGVGEVLDLGSNEQGFWAMVDAPQLISDVPRAVYFARHDQFLNSEARRMMPIQPQWLVEALGLVYLDPAGQHEGPYQRGPGELEIRTRIPTPEGDLTKLMVLHDRFGWIQQQHWYDARGQLLASVFASQHQYDAAVGVSLPHVIEVRLPPPAQALQIQIQNYTVNQLYSDPAQLWTMPAFSGYPLIDLAAGTPPAAATAPPAPPAGPAPSPVAPPSTYPSTTGYRLNYRGYSARRPEIPPPDWAVR